VAIEVTDEGGETVIAISGVFDGDAASKLRALFTRHPIGDRSGVVVDFTRAREITDVGLAALVDGQRTHEVQLRIRGLSQRHNRMLRFLSPDGARDGR
jgi:anti-anti-sigma regulatory factor